MLNSMGERIAHCGTPAVIGAIFDVDEHRRISGGDLGGGHKPYGEHTWSDIDIEAIQLSILIFHY
jgi:hypothetical protein